MITCGLLGLGFVLGATNAYAVWAKYSPFEPGKKLRSFPLARLTPVSQVPDGAVSPEHNEFIHRAEKVTKLKVVWAADGTAGVTLERNGNKLFSGPIKGQGSPTAGVDVYAADLNADSVSDFVIFTDSGGCGLAAQRSQVTFLLSGPNNYRSVGLLSYDVEPADFVDINGRAYWVSSSIVFGDTGRDGRCHNYWVYNLLGFSGGELVLANDLDRRFPKWVWYSFAENHRDTDQLTSAQRRLSLKQVLESD